MPLLPTPPTLLYSTPPTLLTRTGSCSPGAPCYLLLTTYYLLLTTYYLLLTTFYLLLTTHYLLLTTYYLLLITYYLQLITYYSAQDAVRQALLVGKLLEVSGLEGYFDQTPSAAHLAELVTPSPTPHPPPFSALFTCPKSPTRPQQPPTPPTSHSPHTLFTFSREIPVNGPVQHLGALSLPPAYDAYAEELVDAAITSIGSFAGSMGSAEEVSEH